MSIFSGIGHFFSSIFGGGAAYTTASKDSALPTASPFPASLTPTRGVDASSQYVPPEHPNTVPTPTPSWLGGIANPTNFSHSIGGDAYGGNVYGGHAIKFWAGWAGEKPITFAVKDNCLEATLTLAPIKDTAGNEYPPDPEARILVLKIPIVNCSEED